MANLLYPTLPSTGSGSKRIESVRGVEKKFQYCIRVHSSICRRWEGWVGH